MSRTLDEWCDNFEVSIGSKEIDKRHEKRYGREVYLYVKFPDKPWGETLDRHVISIFGAIQELLPEAKGGYSIFGDQRSQSYTYFVESDRPSETVSEEEALRVLDLSVENIREEVIPKAIEAVRASQSKANALREAVYLAEEMAKDSLRKAKEVVRYEQRFAALNAELNAEVDAQLPTFVKELRNDPTYKGGQEMDPRAVEVACRIARDRVYLARPGGGYMPRSTRELSMETFDKLTGKQVSPSEYEGEVAS